MRGNTRYLGNTDGHSLLISELIWSLCNFHEKETSKDKLLKDKLLKDKLLKDKLLKDQLLKDKLLKDKLLKDELIKDVFHCTQPIKEK